MKPKKLPYPNALRRASLFVLCLLPLISLAARCTDTEEHLPKCPPDWKVEIVLKAPQIHYPSVVCTAPDGRVFFGEDPMDMPGPANKPSDRVMCLHPDGKLTVFADNLYAVFGLQYIDGKIYVHHSPKLTVYTDDNGVGKDPVDLIESDNAAPWGGTNLNDHIPSNIRLAMDGYIYMSVGDKGIFNAVGTDKRKLELHGGGIIRLHPDGTGLEIYCSGTRNHLDVSINAEDEMFTYDNTDDGNGWWSRYTHMVDGGYYGYPFDYRPRASDTEAVNKFRDGKGVKPWQPYTLWRMEEYGGGSAVGGTAYNEDALPMEYRGNTFQCEWGKGQFERFQVQREGGSFKVLKRDEFLKRNGGPELRPLGATVQSDGMGFYIADWNYGGWKNKADTGRLIKLTYTGPSMAAPKPAWFVPAAEGKKFEATTQDLVAALSHPAQSVRLVAQRRIAERGAEAIPLLIAVLNDAKAPAWARWSAIWTLDKLEDGKAGRDAIVAVLKDENADLSVRMQAARQLGTRQARESASVLIPLLNHADAAMRFRAATALGRIGDTAAVPALVEKLGESDFFTHFAMFTALNRIGRADPSAWQAISNGLKSSNADVRNGVVYAMRDVYDETLIKVLSAFAADAANSPDSRAAALTAMAPLSKMTKPWNGKWWSTQPVAAAWPVRDVDWAGTVPVSSALQAGLKDASIEVRLAALNALQLAPDPSVGGALADMFQTEKDVNVRKSILKAIAVSKADAAAGFIGAVLKDPVANAALIPDAINVARLINSEEMHSAVIALAGTDAEPGVMLYVIDALAKMRDAKSVPVLNKCIGNTDEKVAEAATLALGGISDDASYAALIGALTNKRGTVKRAAATALEKMKPAIALDPLIAASKDKDVQKEAISTLAAMHNILAMDVYLDGLNNKDGGLREKCRKAITSIHEKALPLIQKRLEITPALSTQVINELQQVYKPFLKAGDNGGKLFGYDTKALSPEAYSEFAMKHPGNAENGKKLFSAEPGVGCIKCHKLGNEGGEVGPSMSGVGAKYDRAKLIESVLYPSKQILDGYQQTIVRTKSGQITNGIVRGETDTEVTLIDNTGQKIAIKKSEIGARKVSEISLMPEGLHTGLKPEEFSDLISFLESLKEKPPEPKK